MSFVRMDAPATAANDKRIRTSDNFARFRKRRYLLLVVFVVMMTVVIRNKVPLVTAFVVTPSVPPLQAHMYCIVTTTTSHGVAIVATRNDSGRKRRRHQVLGNQSKYPRWGFWTVSNVSKNNDLMMHASRKQSSRLNAKRRPSLDDHDVDDTDPVSSILDLIENVFVGLSRRIRIPDPVGSISVGFPVALLIATTVWPSASIQQSIATIILFLVYAILGRQWITTFEDDDEDEDDGLDNDNKNDNNAVDLFALPASILSAALLSGGGSDGSTSVSSTTIIAVPAVVIVGTILAALVFGGKTPSLDKDNSSNRKDDGDDDTNISNEYDRRLLDQWDERFRKSTRDTERKNGQ